MVEPNLKLLKQILFFVFFGSICITAHPAVGQENGPADATPRVLRFALVLDVIPGVDVEDVRLTLKMIVSKTEARKIYPYTAEMDFIPNYPKAAEAIVKGSYHFVILTGMDFADLNQRVKMDPLLILSKSDSPAEPLVLITRKEKSLDRLSRNSGTKLIIDEGRVGVMSQIWLDTVLLESGFDASQAFFSEIIYSRKPSRILLPVFFGKADACVIPKSTFDLMAELNPQIAQTLSVQRQSEALVFWVACATDLATERDRFMFADKSNWLTGDPDVEQAITVVQMKQFYLFEDSYFKATADIFERYERLNAAKRKKDGESSQ